MTIDVDATLAEVEERHRRDREARDELNRRQRDAYRNAREERKASLPHIATVEPAVVEPVVGQRYVLCTVAQVEAWADDRDCAVVAAVGGTWLRAEYARALGIEGEPVELAWRPA